MIVLVGESGSGKSSIEKELTDSFGYEKILMHTTRPIRVGEKEGIDYHFCGEKEFTCRQKEEYISVSMYNNWYYGVPKVIDDDISDKSVIVATPKIFRQLQKSNIKNLCSFYINVPRRDRLIKSLMRNDNIEEVYRRSLTDIGQFDGMSQECDYVISNQLDSNKFNYIFTIHDLAKNINDLYKSNKRREDNLSILNIIRTY